MRVVGILRAFNVTSSRQWLCWQHLVQLAQLMLVVQQNVE